MNDMLLEYIDRIIDGEKDHRVFPVEFNDKTYYVKQDISNHRSSWIKPAPRASFDYEFYKISFVNTQLPVAPVIAVNCQRNILMMIAYKIWSLIFSIALVKHWDNFMTMVCPMAVLLCEISPMIQTLIRLLY